MFSPKINLIEIGENVQSKALVRQAAQKERMTIYGQFDKYIKSKERKVSPATLVVYNIVKGHLRDFEKYRKEKIDFASLDYGFYEDFVTYPYL